MNFSVYILSVFIFVWKVVAEVEKVDMNGDMLLEIKYGNNAQLIVDGDDATCASSRIAQSPKFGFKFKYKFVMKVIYFSVRIFSAYSCERCKFKVWAANSVDWSDSFEDCPWKQNLGEYLVFSNASHPHNSLSKTIVSRSTGLYQWVGLEFDSWGILTICSLQVYTNANKSTPKWKLKTKRKLKRIPYDEDDTYTQSNPDEPKTFNKSLMNFFYINWLLLLFIITMMILCVVGIVLHLIVDTFEKKNRSLEFQVRRSF